MVKPQLELKDLIGLATLDAVDFETAQLPAYEGADADDLKDCNVCRFRLNGTVYVVIEDPNDGYRSSMREIKVAPKAEMVNVFSPVQVLGIHCDRSNYDAAHILKLYDVTTAKPVLEVGTDNSDDYYPVFVANFQPENMASNVGAADRIEAQAARIAELTRERDEARGSRERIISNFVMVDVDGKGSGMAAPKRVADALRTEREIVAHLVQAVEQSTARADALEAQAARIAELEQKLSGAADLASQAADKLSDLSEKYDVLMDRTLSAEARCAALEEAEADIAAIERYCDFIRDKNVGAIRGRLKRIRATLGLPVHAHRPTDEMGERT